MIGIRVDANEKIGLGHLMRCSAIALQLKELGTEILFILSESYGEDILQKNGFKAIVLHNEYEDKIKEIPDLEKIIQDKKIKVMLLDSYQINAGYMEKIKGLVKLVYIDDMKLEKYPVDLLINYTLGTEAEEYLHMGYELDKLLLGSRYMPLRAEFSSEPIVIKEKAEKVFITTGGTDWYGMVSDILGNLCREPFRELKKIVVVGKFFKDDKRIEELKKAYGNIIFFKDICEMSAVMKSCDVAISAGGTTLAELVACGIPTICFSVADNQLYGTQAYEEKGIMYYAGDVRTDKQKVIENIGKSLSKIINNQELRKEVSVRGRDWIDGKGSWRIAKKIRDL